MPDFDAHREAAKCASKSMDLLLSSGDDDCLPWVVATAFYKGVHVVEAMFAVDQIEFHSADPTPSPGLLT